MSEPDILLLPPPEGTPQAGPSGEKWLTFSPTAARATLELVALGKSLFQIEQDPTLPPARTFIQWVMLYPMLARAYATARELSGFMLEEEALFIARTVADPPDGTHYTMAQLKAKDMLLNQLKWSAGKRNPQVFSDKAALNITVPIQIMTTLDMGPTNMESTEQFPNIYEMTANLEQEVPLDEVPLDTLDGDDAAGKGRPARRAPRTAPRAAARSREATDVQPQTERDDAGGAGSGRGAPSRGTASKGRGSRTRSRKEGNAQGPEEGAGSQSDAVSRQARRRTASLDGEEA